MERRLELALEQLVEDLIVLELVQDTAKELAGDRGVVAGQIEVAGGLPGEQLLLADLQRHHDHVEEEGRRQLALSVKITHKQSRDI